MNILLNTVVVLSKLSRISTEKLLISVEVLLKKREFLRPSLH